MKKLIIGFIACLFFTTLAYAEQVRVFYHPDGKVEIRRLDERARWLPGETKEARYERNMNKYPPTSVYEDIDENELPPEQELQDKWRGAKGQGVHIDHSIETKREKIERLNQQLDAELAKPEPDVVEVIKLRRKIEKII